jgi:hypothetical protein
LKISLPEQVSSRRCSIGKITPPKTKKSSSKSVIAGTAQITALQDFLFCVCYRNSLHLPSNVNGKGESVFLHVAFDISAARKLGDN